jgi:serine/threonine protein kinase
MSLEKSFLQPNIYPTARDKEQKIDDLEQAYELLEELSGTPELYDRWENEINVGTAAEGLAKIKNFLALRGAALKKNQSSLKPNYVEHLTELEKRWDREKIDKLREQVRHDLEKHTQSIGAGNTATVFEKVFKDASLSPYCLKVVSDVNALEYVSNRSIKEEFDLMIELWKDNVAGVRIPEPLYWIDLGDKHVLVMEKLDAVPLHLYIHNLENQPNLPIPDDMDIEDFIASLESFIKSWHAKGYYHRDLHGNNVMVDVKTRKPRVIDLGKSKRKTFMDDDPDTEHNFRTGKTDTFMNDLRQIAEFKKSLLNKATKGEQHV